MRSESFVNFLTDSSERDDMRLNLLEKFLKLFRRKKENKIVPKEESITIIPLVQEPRNESSLLKNETQHPKQVSSTAVVISNTVLIRKNLHKGDPLKNIPRKIMKGPPKTAYEKRLWNPKVPIEPSEEPKEND